MVETESSNVSELKLEEVEREGDQIGSKNYRFSKIGEPVPIGGIDPVFDPQSPPFRPLAVSPRFRLLFVAHCTGFCVTRTNDIIKSAEKIKNEANGSSILELCVVDVPIGKVSILALSANSSTLAASVGSHLHLFSVNALLEKEQKPSFSFSLNDSSCIKDLRWNTKSDDFYLALSSNGKLRYGAGQGGFKDVMDEVDAVDWSVEGRFIAVASKNVLSILSSNFKEKVRMMLSFKSCIEDSDANCIIKVDSIRWVRPDSIILGCYKLTDDGKEENYLVQVITGKSGTITNASSNPVVLSFSDVFSCLNDDAVPYGSGPHMCLSYLDTCQLAFTANQKNMDQHIVLFGWAIDEKNEVAMIEIVNDSWLPRISLQGNGDDNLILGLSIDEVSYDEHVKLICGEEDKEVSPCCIVLCLTIDGKLSMFHFASAAGSSVPPEVAYSVSDEEEDNSPLASSGFGELKLSTSEVGESMDKTYIGLQSDELKVNELNGKEGNEIPMKKRIEQEKAAARSEISGGGAQQEVPFVKLNHDRDDQQRPISGKQGGNPEQTYTSQLVGPRSEVRDFSRSETHKNAEVRSTSASFSRQFSTDISNKIIHGASLKDSTAGTGLSGQIGSTSLNSASSVSWSREALISSKPSDEEEDNSPLASSGYGELKLSTSEVGESMDKTYIGLQSDELKVNELNGKEGNKIPMKKRIEQEKAAARSEISGGGAQQEVPFVKLNHDRDDRQRPISGKQGGNPEQTYTSQLVGPRSVVRDFSRSETHKNAEVRSTSASFSRQLSTDISNKIIHGASLKDSTAGTGLSGQIGSTSLNSASSVSWSREALISSKPSDERGAPLLYAGFEGNRSDASLTTANISEGQLHSSYLNKTAGPSTPADHLGIKASVAFAGMTSSLPIVRGAQSQLPEKFTTRKLADFKVQSDTSNQRTCTPTGLSSEPNLSKQIHSVEEMAKELDALLECIEGPGGFNDASIALQKDSVRALEEGIWTLSDRCSTWMEILDHRLEEIQLLPDKMVQVLAKEKYMEGIVKQATDGRYWDLWNRQKLSSELEIKHRHILELSQNLTNQLIELERHLNTLEIKKFGENDGVQMSGRSTQKHGPPRHIQSLHSLHNTMSAQLVAAEQLFECLSEQMAVLRIESAPLRKQIVRKELFDAIGISHDGATFSPPEEEKAGNISSNIQLISSCSAAANSKSTRNQSSSLKSSEPETARRRRDSLGQSWASFEPPKTTVKRMLLQEDHHVSPSRLSSSIVKQQLNPKLHEGSALSHTNQVTFKGKGSLDTSIKQSSEGPLNPSFQWATYRPDLSKPLGSSASSSGYTSKMAPNISQDAARDSPIFERSRNHLNSTEKSVHLTINNAKASQQSESYQYPDQTSSFPIRLTSQIKSREFADSSDKETLVPKPAIGNGKQRPAITESSSLLFRSSLDPPLPTASAAGSSPILSGKSSWSETSTSSSQLSEVVSSSSMLPLSLPVTSPETPSFIVKPTAPTTSSAMSLNRQSTGSGTKINANQTVSLSGSSAFPHFPSTTSLASEQPVSSSSTPPVNIVLKPLKTETMPDNTSTPQASVPKFISMPDEKPSPPQSAFSSDTIRTSSQTGSRLSFSAVTSPALNLASNTKSEQPLQAILPSAVLSTSGTGAGEKNNSSDVAFTQEDEMEEEAPETTQITLGNFSGFGIGSVPNSVAPKPHSFGAAFGDTATNPVSSFTMSAPNGGLFRPASFSIQSPQLSQPPQQTNLSAFSGGFNSGTSNDTSTGKGFGQPAQVGSGQQALGSVLGAFGQSRQLGSGVPGTVASQSAFGSGFGGSQSVGGFSNIATGGGFAAAPSTGGGFASMASPGGGFGGVAPASGGFVAAATASGGFAAAAPGVGGFAGAASASGFPVAGGFGSFSNQGGSGAFSQFGTGGGTARPPSQLFTQMRK